MHEFEVQECFAVTSLGKARASKSQNAAGSNEALKLLASKNPSSQEMADAALSNLVEGMTVELPPAYRSKLQTATQNAQRMKAIYNMLKNEGTYDPQMNSITLPATCQYALHDDLLYLIDPKDKHLRLLLSNQEIRKQQLATAHDETHCGFYRTFKRLGAFYWPSMAKDIMTYIAHCPACLVNKPTRHKPYRKLSPIASPSEPFDTITIDLITDLPPCKPDCSSKIFDTIMTVTDKFSKAVCFIPGRKDWSAVSWSKYFYEDVVLNGWGFPKTIISDQDKRFLSGLSA